MLESETPDANFIALVEQAYTRARVHGQSEPTPADLWTEMCCILATIPDGFTRAFAWRKSRARKQNALHDIEETLRRGLVPGLELCAQGHRRAVIVAMGQGAIL